MAIGCGIGVSFAHSGAAGIPTGGYTATVNIVKGDTTVTHSMGKTARMVQVVNSSSEAVFVDWSIIDTNSIKITSAGAISSATVNIFFL